MRSKGRRKLFSRSASAADAEERSVTEPSAFSSILPSGMTLPSAVEKPKSEQSNAEYADASPLTVATSTSPRELAKASSDRSEKKNPAPSPMQDLSTAAAAPPVSTTWQ